MIDNNAACNRQCDLTMGAPLEEGLYLIENISKDKTRYTDCESVIEWFLSCCLTYLNCSQEYY